MRVELGKPYRAQTPDGAAVWVVSRYAEVRAALADPRLSLNKVNAKPGNYQGFALPPALDANLLNMDAPDHRRIRQLVSNVFTPARVEGLRPKVQAETERLIDGFQPGRADLMGEFAARLPLTVIGDLLGVPQDGRKDFQTWTNAMFDQGDIKRSVGNIVGYLAHLIDTKEPADDLLSALTAQRTLTRDELLSLAFLIFWAGYENSVHLIGNGVLTRLTEPVSDDDLIWTADPSPFAIRRFPLVDVEIGGVRIPAGDTVLLCTAAANRDPERDGQHLTFGHGPHYCLGAPLARLEAEIAIGTLFKRLPGLKLAVRPDALQWRPAWRSRGLLALPVTF